MKPAWVYILKCRDGSYYTGSTTNIHQRIQQHENGEGAEWTKKRLPVEVVFLQEMSNKDEAYQMEQKVKKWSRAKKVALIAGDENSLRFFARKPDFRNKK
ncbi:MAG: GIY-YIG nuclease family protein [Calditrichaeota bacterium]|nr:MAG: GIY-YIG nuclease family protein [Calditrichota bacterium]